MINRNQIFTKKIIIINLKLFFIIGQIFNAVLCFAQVDTALSNKLIQMATLDQKIMQTPSKHIKMASKSHMALIDSIAKVSYREAKTIFETYGFPGFDLVGEEGSKSFWLIVQHCDNWPDFQEQVLKEMETHVKNKNAHSTYYAYLVDRIKIRSGEK